MVEQGLEQDAHLQPREMQSEALVRARAEGVTGEKITIVAYGLGTRRTAAEHAQAVASLGADQVWLAVDATPESTIETLSIRPSGITLEGG